MPEPKVAKNRLHIDLRVPPGAGPNGNWEAVVAKAVQLATAGGTILARFPGHHIVMADPEGNEFCVAAGKD